MVYTRSVPANGARAYLCMKMTLHSSPESATLLRLSVRLVGYGLLDSPQERPGEGKLGEGEPRARNEALIPCLRYEI